MIRKEEGGGIHPAEGFSPSARQYGAEAPSGLKLAPQYPF
jgi:hypothetical protein